MHSYIDVLRSLLPTPKQETMIYARFLEKRQKVLFLSRVKHYSKVAVYSVCVVMIFGAGLLSFQGPTRELYTRTFSNTAIDVFAPKDTTVLANTIGHIVSLEGDVQITQSGVVVPLEYMVADALIILKKGALLTFQVEGGLQTQLVGPARFQLSRSTDAQGVFQYILDIQEGNMIQVASSATGTNRLTTELTIKTPKLQLAAIRSDKKVQLHIDTTLQQHQTITNQGDTITIKSINNNQETRIASLSSQQVLIIDDTGKFQSEIAQLAKRVLVGDQEIYVSLDEMGSGVANTNIGTGIQYTGANEPPKGVVSINKPTSAQPKIKTLYISTKIGGEEVGDTIGAKTLLSADKLATLKQRLYSPILQKSLHDMTISYIKADYQSFLQQKNTLSKILTKMYGLVGFEPHIRVVSSDPQIAIVQYGSLVEQLVLHINRTRGIPQQYVNKLVSIQVQSIIMKNIGYGKFRETTYTDEELWDMIGVAITSKGKTLPSPSNSSPKNKTLD